LLDPPYSQKPNSQTHRERERAETERQREQRAKRAEKSKQGIWDKVIVDLRGRQ
jgi:hypothetical protein